jgi:hypothetical protein
MIFFHALLIPVLCTCFSANKKSHLKGFSFPAQPFRLFHPYMAPEYFCDLISGTPELSKVLRQMLLSSFTAGTAGG